MIKKIVLILAVIYVVSVGLSIMGFRYINSPDGFKNSKILRIPPPTAQVILTLTPVVNSGNSITMGIIIGCHYLSNEKGFRSVLGITQ